MKICIKCNELPARIDPSGNQQSYCSACNKAYGKQNYQDNKSRYYKHAKHREEQLDQLINTFKNKPCADCKKDYPAYVMDLDHKDPSNKLFKVSDMRRRKMAFEKIKQEMLKCDVVCANCHRERTNQQNPARYSKP